MADYLTPVRKPCPCGSGEGRRELVDAMGVFCCFVCDRCEPAKRQEFNPAIFDGRTYPQDEPIEPEWPDAPENHTPTLAYQQAATALAAPDSPADITVNLQIGGNALLSILNAAQARASHHGNNRLLDLIDKARDELARQRRDKDQGGRS